jgi:hypothetical protein
VGWDGRGGVIQRHASQADDQGLACAGCGFWLEAAQAEAAAAAALRRARDTTSEERLNRKAVYNTNNLRGGAS